MAEATKHDVPQCTCCGHIGPWKVEPILTAKHWVIGIILLCLGVVPGVVFIGTSLILRSRQNKRDKICANCKARNLFTFMY